jgi:hypothetical protein
VFQKYPVPPDTVSCVESPAQMEAELTVRTGEGITE